MGHGSKWILTPTKTEQPPKGGEAEDEESGDESDSESSQIEAPPQCISETMSC